MKTEKLKKIVLLVSGPGVLLYESVVLFIHLFTETNAKSWIVAGLFIFFLVFIPLYSFEYFRQEFKKDDTKNIRIKRKNTRLGWHGGNIHGKVPKEEKRPGRMFNS